MPSGAGWEEGAVPPDGASAEQMAKGKGRCYRLKGIPERRSACRRGKEADEEFTANLGRILRSLCLLSVLFVSVCRLTRLAIFKLDVTGSVVKREVQVES